MKIIKNSAITDIIASSENSNFPASKLMNRHPKDKWQAESVSVNSAVLSIFTSGVTGSLGIVGIIADSAAVSISDPNGIEWGDSVNWKDEVSPREGEVSWISTPEDLNVTTNWGTSNDFATLWVDFAQFDSTVEISVTLYKAVESPNILSAGVVVAGPVEEIPGVQYPLVEGMVDYSIQFELSNGAMYYKRRDIVRTFSGSIFIDRKNYFWKFMREIARQYGKLPMMFSIDDSEGEWTIYARFVEMPIGNHISCDYSEIDFELIEEL